MPGRVSTISVRWGARSPIPQPATRIALFGHAISVERCAPRRRRPTCLMRRMDDAAPLLTWGREVTGDLAAAERREWVCGHGIRGFAAGPIAGAPTPPHHRLLIAALPPPPARTPPAA